MTALADADLRSFLALVEAKRPADLVRVNEEVSPRFETAAIVSKLQAHRRSPILHFENVAGCSLPLVTNVCGSMGRLALALGCSLKEVAGRYGAAESNAVAPQSVTDPSVQRHVARGEDVDLGFFPRLVYHADDAEQPYITAAIVSARDPDSGIVNLSYHRMMIAGPRRTGIYMERGRHLHGIFERYVARGQDMPIAVMIGVHPLVSLGSLYSGPADVDEFSIIGGLFGAPLGIASSITDANVPVVADAQFVLEGRVSATETMTEGPFGEFTGYGTGVTQSPVFHVAAVTHCDEPVVQDIVSGHMEHLVLSMPALEHRTLRDARAVCASVTAVNLPAPLTSVIAIDKRSDAEPRAVIDALLASDIYAKQVIVVDADVDPSDLAAVLSASALQAQPDRDVVIVDHVQGTPLDPSCPREDGIGAKIGIDATRKLSTERSVTRNRIDGPTYDAVDVKRYKRR